LTLIALCLLQRLRLTRQVLTMTAQAGLILQKPQRKPQNHEKPFREPSRLWVMMSSEPSIMQRSPANITKRPKKVTIR
jgi:hypothetical protein